MKNNQKFNNILTIMCHITKYALFIIIIIIIMNLTADQSCSHAVSMSSKHAGKSER